eukprot:2147051-Amphidinium_carterae.2
MCIRDSEVEERERYIAELEFFRQQQLMEQQRRMEQRVPWLSDRTSHERCVCERADSQSND